ncbi:MAG: sigma-70 family RNA polymerase sigma factor [Balneolaceae bacterium]
MLTETEPNRSNSQTDSSDSGRLWNEIRDGERSALSELFCLYYRPLYLYGCTIVRCEELIKDSIQDLFLTLWKNRTTINDARSVSSYLMSSLRRMLLRKIRKQRSICERNKSWCDQVAGYEPTIEELWARAETDAEHCRLLAGAMECLSGRQKEAIYLKYYGGMSNSEISTVMEINRQSVYNHVSEAIRQMQGYIRQVKAA